MLEPLEKLLLLGAMIISAIWNWTPNWVWFSLAGAAFYWSAVEPLERIYQAHIERKARELIASGRFRGGAHDRR